VGPGMMGMHPMMGHPMMVRGPPPFMMGHPMMGGPMFGPPPGFFF
jgi:hypothetical protein